MNVCLEQRTQLSEHSLRPLDIMSEAQCLLEYQSVEQQQAALTDAELDELHNRLLGPRGLYAQLVGELEQVGRQAPLLDDLALLGSRELRTQADKALGFVMGHHRLRGISPNPFRGMSRERLCCLAYTQDNGFILVERYAALLTLRQQDSRFFARLIDTTRKSVERRLMFRGLLEHYDALLPIERSIYPAGYRQAQQEHLDHEQSVYGELNLAQPLWLLLEKHSIAALLKRVAPPQVLKGKARTSSS